MFIYLYFYSSACRLYRCGVNARHVPAVYSELRRQLIVLLTWWCTCCARAMSHVVCTWYYSDSVLYSELVFLNTYFRSGLYSCILYLHRGMFARLQHLCLQCFLDWISSADFKLNSHVCQLFLFWCGVWIPRALQFPEVVIFFLQLQVNNALPLLITPLRVFP